MSCTLIMIFKELKRVEHNSLDLNEYQFMKKYSERNYILHNNSERTYFFKVSVYNNNYVQYANELRLH